MSIKRGTPATDGFTLMELLIVMALMTLFIAIAMPSVVQFRRNAEYRAATTNIVNMLNLAKNTAISTNIEHQMVIDPVNRRYGFSSSNPPQAYSAVLFNPISAWTNLERTVTITAPVAPVNIQFTPNGAASASVSFPVNIDISDDTGILRYTVTVQNTGRITVAGH